jgi:hypothetical protein
MRRSLAALLDAMPKFEANPHQNFARCQKNSPEETPITFAKQLKLSNLLHRQNLGVRVSKTSVNNL